MIQVLQRAAAVLRSLDGRPEGRTLADIAAEVGLPRSTVHRIVLTLQADHLVVAASAEGGYRLGPGLMRLAASANRWFVTHVHENLRQLSQHVNETVDLSIQSGSVVLFIDQVPVAHRLQAVSAVGLSFPLHCTAAGKALLADLPLHEAMNLLSGPLDRHTPQTTVAADELMTELETVRTSRVAFDRQEHHMGICAVATALKNPSGLAAAISIPVPANRFDGRETELTRALLAARDDIETSFAG